MNNILNDEIFVFGSNLQGIHGKGAALTAKVYYGAQNGNPRGLQGKSYAVPTKVTPYTSMTRVDYFTEVGTALDFFRSNPQLKFKMTPVGTGLAGFTIEELEFALRYKGGLPSNVRILWEQTQPVMTSELQALGKLSPLETHTPSF